MIDKIAFTHYNVSNMDRAVDFYQNALGLKLLFKREDWSEFEIGGQRFALRKVGNSPQNSMPGGAVISFQAEPIEDVIASLKKRGTPFIEELRVFDYGKLATFADPDGNRVGLYQPPEKSNRR